MKGALQKEQGLTYCSDSPRGQEILQNRVERYTNISIVVLGSKKLAYACLLSIANWLWGAFSLAYVPSVING